MSCHVMSCRHYCINSKKSFSKTFSFHKIIYKYFAGFLACIYDIIRCHYEGNARDICPPLASNPISVDCHAFARNDRYKNKNRTHCAPHGDDNNSHYEGNARSNLFCVDCFAHARTRCASHGNDNIFCDNKNFQFDKFQRLLSVIYKKNSLTKEISK